MASTFRCESCDQSFPAEELADHVRTVHGVAVEADRDDLVDPPAPPRRPRPDDDRAGSTWRRQPDATPLGPARRRRPDPDGVERLGWGAPEPELAEIRRRARSHAETADLLSTAVLLLGAAGAVALALSGISLAYAATALLSTLVTWALLRAAAILLLLAEATAADSNIDPEPDPGGRLG